MFRGKAVGGPARTLDATECRKALEILADMEAGIELRALPAGRSTVLHSADLDGLVEAADAYCMDGQQVYYCLNPVPPELGHAARKDDPLRRRWLLIDVDPVKGELHKNDSATDEEKAAAWRVTEAVISHLSSLGWPLPVIVDTGNGFHLLYRLDTPCDNITHAAIKRLLYTLADQFDTEEARIDIAVHNPSRIAKLPGSWAMKGPDLPERPWRRCKIISVPACLFPVELERIINTGGGQPKAEFGADKPKTKLKGKAAPAGKSYGQAALDQEIGRIAQAKPGDRNNALNRAAFSLGQLVGGGELDEQTVVEALERVAAQVELDDGEIGPTIASGLTAGKAEPRRKPEQQATEKPADPVKQPTGVNWIVMVNGEIVADGKPEDLGKTDTDKPKEHAQQFDIYTLPELMSIKFPDPQWLVPGILSEGLNILAGKPKQGKSMMALNLAMTIAGGGKALGDIQTSPGDVLYMALEDRWRRLQTRARKMAKLLPQSPRLSLITRWPRQSEGGVGLLDAWFKHVKEPKLVIIDVWTMFRTAYKTQGSQYEQDYQHMAAVKEFLEARGCNCLVLHHCKKGPSEDVLEEVSGTMGLTGVADGIIVLNRSRNDNDAKIFVTGRDVQESELALRFDPETLTWKSLGDAEACEGSKIKSAIMEVFRKFPGGQFFPKEMGELTKMDHQSVKTTLYRMAEEGLLGKVGQKYVWPGVGKASDEEEM